MFRLRFSLKWFLLATVGVGVFIGTIGKQKYREWERRRWFARQQQIAEKLTATGSQVDTRDGRIVEILLGTGSNGGEAMASIADATELERFIAHCPVSDGDVARLQGAKKIRHLSVFGAGITNHSLKVIEQFQSIGCLTVGRSSITDDGLAHLGDLKELESISLPFAPIQGRGLACLARLDKLKYLSLRGSAVDDDGLRALADCNRLETIDLDVTRVSGRGLSYLGKLRKLEGVSLREMYLSHGEGLTDLDRVQTLPLDYSRFEPGFLRHIANMENLRFLGLLRAKITDDSLAELKDARQIEELRLTNTAVTDAGLVHLRDLKQLKTLTVTFTAVTDVGARELSQYLPNTTIVYAKGDTIGPTGKNIEPRLP